MNPKFLDQNLFAEYEAMFVGHEEAWDFLKVSCEYYEHIDDLVDETVTTVDVKETTSLAACSYNHPYWRKHGAMLYLLIVSYIVSILTLLCGNNQRKNGNVVMLKRSVTLLSIWFLLLFCLSLGRTLWISSH